MTAYYSENDPFAAAWLNELIKENLIAPGEVDTRSICDVAASDLGGFTQHHFFAGIGGWSYALRLAGWADDRPVWTGSCPCPPYSVAAVAHGGAKGSDDSRDLWPECWRLCREYGPDTFFGEQVANAVSWGWLDRAALDFETENYALGALVLRADSYGAAHERKRIYFVAHASGERRARHQQIECVSVPAPTTLPISSNPLARARSALDGDYSDLLHCDGLSVVLERRALKAFGNAIVPQVAAEFIRASMNT